MTTLVHRRCLHHAEREAVARCPECSRFFCRECVSEHDDRILCTSCLGRLAAVAPRRVRGFGGILLAGQSVVAVAVIWFFFFLIGRALVAMPDDFHEKTIWHVQDWDSE